MENRGLLTEDDRELFRGEKDLDAETERKRRNERRHNIRKRIERIKEDLEILEVHGEDDIVDEFHAETDEMGQLRERVEALEAELDRDS